MVHATVANPYHPPHQLSSNAAASAHPLIGKTSLKSSSNHNLHVHHPNHHHSSISQPLHPHHPIPTHPYPLGSTSMVRPMQANNTSVRSTSSTSPIVSARTQPQTAHQPNSPPFGSLHPVITNNNTNNPNPTMSASSATAAAAAAAMNVHEQQQMALHNQLLCMLPPQLASCLPYNSALANAALQSGLMSPNTAAAAAAMMHSKLAQHFPMK
ncbi:hypothetical protein BLOT_007110 [Blomia tropicalis]|nr:hypothetical protein BLOT_007110 [Blomia tropicalis]